MSADSTAVCFVGAGNMAEALIRALVKDGTPASSLRVTDVRGERLEFFRRELGGLVLGSVANRVLASCTTPILLIR